jgi:hypothetical protein
LKNGEFKQELERSREPGPWRVSQFFVAPARRGVRVHDLLPGLITKEIDS